MKKISVKLEHHDADHEMATVTWNTGHTGAGKLTIQVSLTVPAGGRPEPAALEGKALERARQIVQRFIADLDDEAKTRAGA